ncbi:type I methionyl aminopeptidase [Glaesserella parasuis]|uniref:type I methionyl aminopeptidase n=1 Tax=Glaesserella parasuis TaxID=738 RepID=UPI0013667873|nr:type I methionyl aminopeptidase [Glaesserella parasuis]MDG6410115.1 type I methionyl aminopeptidase [Glaesserella parasuis]MDO9781132.1 type I methionyl aminopeptidase [Glaesserella parasuis]MDO9827154.1 type I methionyl aminopeptidase [Glaesserella parasuis]MDO9855794.1 type I methionyl aminopeptidase [Glaesserella parasuis]MDO9858176.1 type I methionyl aminopeptidase [Glaesserella parasuis]
MKNIPIRSEAEIEKLRIACKLASDVLVMIEPYVKEGISTGELDRICHEYIEQVQKAIPSCLGYHGYPKATCISLNEVVCHGIPNPEKKLKKGDILNIDVTVMKDGYYGDNSKMYAVGEPTIKDKRLLEVTQECLYIGLCAVKPGIRLNQIGKAIQQFAEKEGFSVVREYCGHGIGDQFHCEPQVLHYFSDDGGVVLQEGMVFTIEPMINAGKKEIRLMGDGWTVKTKDRSHSAQYEHQIVVTKDGCEVMTIRDEEIFEGRISRLMKNT